MLMAGTVYSSLSPPARQQQWLPMPLREVLGAVADAVPPAEPTLLLQASAYDEEAEEDVPLPTVVYRRA